jgi:hypothetical protein
MKGLDATLPVMRLGLHYWNFSTPDDPASIAPTLAETARIEAVEKTVMVSRPVLDDVDALLADAERYARLGVSEIQVLPYGHPVRFMEQVAARVIPQMTAIP